MLVKLSDDVWVNPSRVSSLRIDHLDGGSLNIITQDFYFSGIKANIDEMATIINNSLNQQSFGGEDEKAPESA